MFGHAGRSYLALNGGLVTRFYKDRELFRIIVLHELAHIRNADVSKTYFAVAISAMRLKIARICPDSNTPAR